MPEGPGRTLMKAIRTREDERTDRRRALAGIPILPPTVRVERKDDGRCFLYQQLHRGPGLLDRFRPRTWTRQFELDAFGRFIVDQLDGRRSVQDILVVFEPFAGLSHRESELGLVAFLKMLVQRGLVTVVPPEDRAS